MMDGGAKLLCKLLCNTLTPLGATANGQAVHPTSAHEPRDTTPFKSESYDPASAAERTGQCRTAAAVLALARLPGAGQSNHAHQPAEVGQNPPRVPLAGPLRRGRTAG